MNPCDCTKLTGECQHDCPACGGEGILAEPRASKLTAEEIDELMEKGEEDVRDLRERLAPVFRLPRRPIRLD